MTVQAMQFCAHSLLDPYVQSVRNQLSDWALKVCPVADNHGKYTHRDILALLERTGVAFIWLRPRSRRFPQRLDMAVSGSFKWDDGNWQRPEAQWKAEYCASCMPGVALRLLDVSTRGGGLERLN
jgi:hypothetical protein